MTLSVQTMTLLNTLDFLSRHRLTRREDLGVLLELGAPTGRSATLDDLAFRAKFLTRTLAIMQRIGRGGNGYDRLESEFAASMDVARNHVRTLLGGAPEDVRDRIIATYLTMTPTGLNNLMGLLADFTWYKNWLLDNKQARG